MLGQPELAGSGVSAEQVVLAAAGSAEVAAAGSGDRSQMFGEGIV